MIWNEDEKEREPRKDNIEEKTRVRNKIKLRNQEIRAANNLQWGEIPTSTLTNHTLPEVGQIMDTRWAKLPVRQRSLISRKNKEKRQDVPSSSPLEKENAVQTAVKQKPRVGTNEW